MDHTGHLGDNKLRPPAPSSSFSKSLLSTTAHIHSEHDDCAHIRSNQTASDHRHDYIQNFAFCEQINLIMVSMLIADKSDDAFFGKTNGTSFGLIAQMLARPMCECVCELFYL